jgi:hypothetical protein
LFTWAQVHGLALLCNEGVIGKMSKLRGTSEARTLDAIFGIMRSRLER